MRLADRLSVPAETRALLFDMDGVLLDTLSMDYKVVHQLLQSHDLHVEISQAVIRENFPYDVREFWQRITETVGLHLDSSQLDALAQDHAEERQVAKPAVHQGIREILDAAREADLQLAVVSNNPMADIKALLESTGLLALFDHIVGNDVPGMAKKPEPDFYVEAARQLGVSPVACVAIEDSLVGAEAAWRAGCHTIGVAGGANSFAEIEHCPYTAFAYTSFAVNHISLGREGVTQKSLESPNEFVSHMIEHIAWRLGCSVQLQWTNDDWHQMGAELGHQVAALGFVREASASLGMIDDGSAEVRIRTANAPRFVLDSTPQVDLEWFTSLRCEQLVSGKPLVAVLDGLSIGAGLDLRVTVASLEDPHHTWEGIFRGVGIALDKMCNPRVAATDTEPAAMPESAEVAMRDVALVRSVEQGWSIEHVSLTEAKLSRHTAESEILLHVSMSGNKSGGPLVTCKLDVADSIHVDGVSDLLLELAKSSGLQIDVSFRATKLSSSHVVTEDIGLALGKALRAIAVERMEHLGIQGAGSNVDAEEDLAREPIRVGISMEGRKFWKYVPFQQSYNEFRQAFLVGHTLKNGLFTEDVDDFIDGLAGGMGASVMVHLSTVIDPVEGWPLLFRSLGFAIAELLTVNPYRRAVTAGVKATLA